MVLNRLTVAQLFKIRQPRWHDKTVLIAARRVGTHNEIVFTQTPSMPGSYYISGRDAHMSDITTNGKIRCYAIPLDSLEPLERQ